MHQKNIDELISEVLAIEAKEAKQVRALGLWQEQTNNHGEHALRPAVIWHKK